MCQAAKRIVNALHAWHRNVSWVGDVENAPVSDDVKHIMHAYNSHAQTMPIPKAHLQAEIDFVAKVLKETA